MPASCPAMHSDVGARVSYRRETCRHQRLTRQHWTVSCGAGRSFRSGRGQKHRCSAGRNISTVTPPRWKWLNGPAHGRKPISASSPVVSLVLPCSTSTRAMAARKVCTGWNKALADCRQQWKQEWAAAAAISTLLCHQRHCRTGSGWPPGIDVRANGGMVVPSPSSHPSGAIYQCRPGHSPGATQVARLPSRLLNLALRHRAGRGHPSAYWRDLLNAGAEEGARNNTIASLAGICYGAAWIEMLPRNSCCAGTVRVVGRGLTIRRSCRSCRASFACTAAGTLVQNSRAAIKQGTRRRAGGEPR
jgi:hypothetical protein